MSELTLAMTDTFISNFVAEAISAALTVASKGEGSEQQVAQQVRRSPNMPYKPSVRIICSDLTPC
jgi:hypothetical protein